MPLLDALRIIADFVAKTVRVTARFVNRSVIGARWLVRIMHDLRMKGSGGAYGLARTFDVHGAVAAADLSLLAAVAVAPGAPSPNAWVLAGGTAVLLSAVAVWGTMRAGESGRAVLGLSLTLRGIATVVAAQWLPDAWWLLLALTALILPQWLVHSVLLGKQVARRGRRVAMLGRAAAYGLVGGACAGVVGLIVGAVLPGFPRWVAAGLLTVAALLALRLPATPVPVSRLAPAAPRQTRRAPSSAGPPSTGDATAPAAGGSVPTQAGEAAQGYRVYRPASLDATTDTTGPDATPDGGDPGA